MKDLVSAVMDSIHMAGLVEIEVSAKHVHLTKEDVEVLFGKGAVLEPARPLSQPGQFLSQQRVTLVGPKKRMERVAVLGPCRAATQVELSKSDCVHHRGTLRKPGHQGRGHHCPQPHPCDAEGFAAAGSEG